MHIFVSVGKLKTTPKRASKLSIIEVFKENMQKKADLKAQELAVRKAELELKQREMDREDAERKEREEERKEREEEKKRREEREKSRADADLKERQTMLELLQKLVSKTQ